MLCKIATGVNVLKRFSSSLTLGHYKLACSSMYISFKHNMVKKLSIGKNALAY